MKTNVEKFFMKSVSFAIAMFCVCLMNDNAVAAGRVAVRNTPSNRKTITTTTRTSTNTNTVTTTAEPEQVAPPTPETVVVENEPEPTIIENKSNQFSNILSDAGTSTQDETVSNMAELIKKQRAAYAANENATFVQQEQQKALATGKNACDSGLRKCMSETCGANFTKCALDGDTIFGDKLNKCRRETTCTGEEFKLFTTEIRADRDLNVKMASYTSVIECGNSYNSCIQTECGETFNKCLGKAAADKAIKKCSTIAKNCTEQDSGLSSRMGVVIGKLRENAEKDVKTDEKRLYELRDLMRKQCEHLGAMFDERTFDCVYTINFFAGENQSSPTASRKAYAGSSFVCTQEWFGINATTFKENAYRETRAQTGASAAMLGSGLGTAAGLITSGAIDRALDTQNAKKALKDECKSQGGKLKNGECVLPEDEEDKNNKPSNKKGKGTTVAPTTPETEETEETDLEKLQKSNDYLMENREKLENDRKKAQEELEKDPDNKEKQDAYVKARKAESEALAENSQAAQKVANKVAKENQQKAMDALRGKNDTPKALPRTRSFSFDQNDKGTGNSSGTGESK